MQRISTLLGVRHLCYLMVILKTFLIVLSQLVMMNREEFFNLLFKLSIDYSGCNLHMVRYGRFNRYGRLTQIEGNLFYGLSGYDGSEITLPDGIYFAESKFSNGAMCLKRAE